MTLSIAITIMSVVYISILYCNNNDNVIIMITIIKVIKTIVILAILVIIVMIMMTTMIIIIIIVIVIIYSDNSQIVIIVIQSWYIMIIIMVYHDNYNKCTITITQKNMTYVLKISPHLYIIYIYIHHQERGFPLPRQTRGFPECKSSHPKSTLSPNGWIMLQWSKDGCEPLQP